jgi:F0F1-type ATP synthase membrane subunit b/b'
MMPYVKLGAACYGCVFTIFGKPNSEEKGIMLKAIISLILVDIFLYLIITAIQRYMTANEEVEQAEKAALRSQQEADQAIQEFEQTANEYIKVENERNQRIGNAIEEVEKAQSELNELDRQYAADVAQRTAEGCTAKQFDQFGHVTLWSCPVK